MSDKNLARTGGGRPGLPQEVRQEIREKFAQGEKSREELAAEYKVSYNTIRNILKEEAAA